ncbi:hypothetical protein [Pseudarthrobacter sp. NIBRBAC000502770]|uniref:hypothetical protein n=1 Tax=Pseudarthrobacter sp. NIBRBAC000502770 TaxID=2590785 RepID=UPI00114091FD|nr:hypothetical protein [Pseudarthrobacter sp. NIBRBAC000502770]QDG88081.1 hypothetical protein NIBR502770_05975 [Pseudarthrobacter sp. NIBRBAC000502770]
MINSDETIPGSVQVKLDRAREHVGHLTEAVRNYVRDELSVRRQVESDGREHVFFWETYSAPPPRLGLVIGDAVHNLRSALDHLVVSLAKEGAQRSGTMLSVEDEHRLQYPIFTSETKFNQKRARYLKFVPESMVEYIRGRQPFTIASASHVHFLARIHELDNTDKHRQINVPVMLRRDLLTDWPPEIECTVVDRNTTPQVGAELTRFVFRTPQEARNVPIQLTFSVQLPGPGSVQSADYVLSSYIDNVEALIRDIVTGAVAVGSLIMPNEDS